MIFGTCNWRGWCSLSKYVYPCSCVFPRGQTLHKTLPKMSFDFWYFSSSLVSPPPDRSCCIFPNRFSNDLASPWLQIWRGWFSTEWGPSRWLRWVTGAGTIAGTLAFERKSTSVCSVVWKQSQWSQHAGQVQSGMLPWKKPKMTRTFTPTCHYLSRVA